MLAILERLVTDAGGTWLYCDTDSMAIVANEDGSLVPCVGGPHNMPNGREAIRALSYEQVERIRETMNRLNPYDRAKVPQILKREAACYGYAVSAKRYTLFTYESGRPIVPDKIEKKEAYSRHGLGMYLDPAGREDARNEWIRETWQYLVDKAHGLNPAEPPWFDNPAITKITISSPHVMRRVREFNDGKTYNAMVKPYNFALVATERDKALASGTAARRLIAPYALNPELWRTQDWYDLDNQNTPPIPGDSIRLRTMRSVVLAYAAHAEEKALGYDGHPCGVETVGLLRRRTVRVTSLLHIGKETNKLEDVENKLIGNASDVITEYPRRDRGHAVAVIERYSRREFAAMVNKESDDIRQKMRDAATAAKRDARYNDDIKHLTGDARTAALNADIEGQTAYVMARYGMPVTIDDHTITRFVEGSNTRQHNERAIIRTAAKLAARKANSEHSRI